jgi:hypothetical protein
VEGYWPVNGLIGDLVLMRWVDTACLTALFWLQSLEEVGLSVATDPLFDCEGARCSGSLILVLVTNGGISDGGVRSTPIGSCVRLAPEGFVASFVLGLYPMSGASEARKGIGEGLLHVSRFRLCGGVGWSGEGSSSLGVLSRPACSYMWLHGVLS